MKTSLILASALALTLAGTGCATKKYVARTVAPVETRVTGTETKNADQDKQIGDQGKKLDDQGQELSSISTDLSRTKERLTDADAKAVAAGQAAQRAADSASKAQSSADSAQTSADRFGQRANQREDTIEKNMAAMNKFNMTTSETVLFNLNQSTLTKEAKEQLDSFAKMVGAQDRYIVEVQGYTDKTGSLSTNEQLSQARAASVTRYLVNEHKIPIRTINTLGSGYAAPVADDKTRDGRKQNRRVEVRLWVPENASSSSTVASTGGK